MDVMRTQERILSQKEKQSVTVPQERYYGLLIFAGKVLEMDIFDGGILRRD